MRRAQVVQNALATVVQMLVVGASYFVLYRFVYQQLGIEALGIWSSVLAVTSVSRLSQLGLGPSLSRFVAQRLAQNDHDGVIAVLHSGQLMIGLFTGVASLAIALSAPFFLHLFVQEASLAAGLSLVPWALLSLWINALSGVQQAGLDGAQRMDLRSLLVTLSTLLYVGISLMWLPHFGVLALAYAQVIQAATLYLGTSLLLRRRLGAVPLLPTRASKPVVKEMLAYGLSIQALAGLTMVLDAATKALLSTYGGLAMVGWFEMANRLVTQIRSLLSAASQALVPAFAHAQAVNPEEVRLMYKDSYGLFLFVCPPIFGLSVLATPFISEVWIGHYEPLFVNSVYMLSVGMYLAMFSTPAYTANLGLGTLAPNAWAGAFIMGVLVTLGPLLGMFWQGEGVVAAYSAGFGFGGAALLAMWHYRYRLPLRDLLPAENLALCAATSVATGAGLLGYYWARPGFGLYPVLAYATLAWATLVLPVVWRHPMRPRLQRLVLRRAT
ncbi:MAG: hypothetical protein RJA70_72 [Pseudomonadota bacterium]